MDSIAFWSEARRRRNHFYLTGVGWLVAVCKANSTEFENAKLVPDHVVLTESALGNREVAIVFKPREEWPKMFKFLRLYREPPPVQETPASDA